MPLSQAFGKGRTVGLAGQSSPSSSSRPAREYSPGLSQEAIDILENGCPSPDIPVRTTPYRFRFNVPSPASRQFAPVPSPLEHLVPHTPKTRLVSPSVADHLDSTLASSPKVYDKYRHAGAKSFFSKMVERLINAIHPPLTRRNARLIPSTLEDIVDYLSDQHSKPEVHHDGFGDMSQAGKKKTMLVFDVFTTENRALRAFAIGPSPQAPLYMFYPLRHPYDEALLETLANRGDGICIYPPYLPDPDDIEEQDTVEEKKEEKKVEQDNKDTFWKKAIKKLCDVTMRKPSRRPTSIPLKPFRPVAVGPAEPPVTHPLSQSFLQFRDPLEGFKSETISGIRWSSLWINQRFHNCLNDRPAPEPTEEELTAQARRMIRIVCYEARLAKLTGVQKWFYELLHKKSVHKVVKIKGKAVAREPSGESQYAQHEAHKGMQDAGAIFIEPDVTIPQDVRVAEYIFPAVNSKKDKRGPVRCSHCSTDTGYSSARDLSTVISIKSEGFVSSGQQEKPKIALQSKHPILRRDPVARPLESHTRRPQTIHDLSTLISHLRLPPPTLQPDESAFHTEYVIADEYLSLHQNKNPDELVADEPGIQIFYEPPAFRTKAEKKGSDVEYISGRYLWVHKRTTWAVVYERRKPSKTERLESMKLKQEERKEWEDAQRTWGNSDWKSKGERLQKKLAKGPPMNFGRVKLYTPACSEQELLGYLNLEKGQLSVRRDVTAEQLHLAVLAMFSVVNFEEAVEEERKLLKTFEAAKDLTGLKALLAHNQQDPEGNPATAKEGVQGSQRPRCPESGLLGTEGPTLQLFGTGKAAEEFVIVGDNNTKTYFGSAGVQELVKRAMAPSTVESDSGSVSDSDSESNSIQEIIRRTSGGWKRRSDLPQDAEQGQFQPPRCSPMARLPSGP
ncbi:hypothetical protein EV426DRAFT_721253 [Tirmania nivea]|nr:hypothetical protein EV426DRAFT_721253 [Tirmania nivea]